MWKQSTCGVSAGTAFGVVLGLVLGLAACPELTSPAWGQDAAAVAEPAAVPVTPQEVPVVTEEAFLAPLEGWIRAGAGEPAAVDASAVSTLPAVAALRADLGAARARLLAARTLENPELGLSYESSGDASGSGGGAPAETETELALAWQPPRPDRRRLETAAAEAGVAAARARLAADLRELRLAWRRDFALWSLAAARRQRLVEHGEGLHPLALRTARRAEAGEQSGLDARRVALAAAVVEAERAQAEAALLEARAAVRTWRPDLPAEAVPVLPPLPPLPDAASPAPPPALAAVRAELREARLEAEAAERVLSLPRLSAGWQRREVGGEEVHRPVLGLAWPLPLFDRDRPRRLEAHARAEALEARVELLRRRLETERTAARAAYEALRGAAHRAGEAALAGPPAVAAATAAFAAGELELTVLLETLAADRAANAAALDLVEQALAAHRRLERLGPAEAAPPVPPVAGPGPQAPGTASPGTAFPGRLPGVLGPRDATHESTGDIP